MAGKDWNNLVQWTILTCCSVYVILDVSQRDFTTSFLSEHTELYITGTVFIFLSWFQIRICINTTGRKPEFLEKVALLFNLFLLIFFFQNVHVHIADMSNPRGLWEFADSFSQNHSVHVLVSVFMRFLCVLQRSCYNILKMVHKWQRIVNIVYYSWTDQQCWVYGESARGDRGWLGEKLCHQHTW